MNSEYVTVVGAGPVGLIAAVSLIENGIPVIVLEESADLAVDLRASTFHPPTLEFLDKLNLADDLISRGIKCPFWQFRDRKEGEIATFDLGLLKDYTNHPYRLQAEQWKLTETARKRLDESDLAQLITDISVKSIEQNSDFVTVHAERKTGEKEIYQTRFLVGADGARSTIRSETKVGFPGLTIPEIFLSLSTPFRYDQAIDGLADISYISDPNEWLVLLRTPTLWRVLFPTDPNLSDAEIIDSDRVEERMQNLLPGEPYEIKHKTAYRVHERVADKYVHGRVFLAGDAAHLNNPLGGMGMNGGIHDAVNLADKLTEVWKGASITLMDRYERQRRKVAIETVQAQALRNRTVLNEKDPQKRAAYHDELRQIVSNKDKHTAYVLKSSMIQSLRELDAVQ
jgi:3-(3-hydroxy-phenyl)propionate hydroxylase